LGTVDRRFTFLCGLGELGTGLQLPSVAAVSAFSDKSANVQQLLPAAGPASVVAVLLLLLLLLSLVAACDLSCNAELSRSNVRRTSAVGPLFKLSN